MSAFDLPSTREIAIVSWLTPLLAYCLIDPRPRKPLSKVVSIFAASPIRTILLLQTLYVLLILLGLDTLGFWSANFPQVKATLLWFLLFASVSIFRAQNAQDDPEFFRKALQDNLRLVIVLEFVLSYYAFSLTAELLLFPILVFFTLLLAVSQADEKHKPVESFVNTLFIGYGAFVIYYAGHRLFNDPTEFFQTQTFIDLYTPPLLSICFLPFVFFLSVYMVYETVFIQLSHTCADEALLNAAKRRAFFSFGWRAKDLKRWASSTNYDRIEQRSDIKRTIDEIKALIAYEKNPRDIPAAEGWSPYAAMEFVGAEGFTMSHYQKIGTTDWSSSSNHLDLGEDLLPNCVTYRVSGGRYVANVLTLRLSVHHPDRPDELARYATLAEALLSEALGGSASTNLRKIIASGQDAELLHENKVISVVKEPWPSLESEQYDLIFQISVTHKQA